MTCTNASAACGCTRTPTAASPNAQARVVVEGVAARRHGAVALIRMALAQPNAVVATGRKRSYGSALEVAGARGPLRVPCDPSAFRRASMAVGARAASPLAPATNRGPPRPAQLWQVGAETPALRVPAGGHTPPVQSPLLSRRTAAYCGISRSCQ